MSEVTARRARSLEALSSDRSPAYWLLRSTTDAPQLRMRLPNGKRVTLNGPDWIIVEHDDGTVSVEQPIKAGDWSGKLTHGVYQSK